MPVPEPQQRAGDHDRGAPSPSVVVVEDDRSMALLVVYMLEREGYRVASAADGAAGLAAVRELRPRVLVLDLTLPEMSGDDVCRAIRSDPELRDTFVLVMTALEDTEARRRVRDAGADCYMCKPFDPVRLLAIVRDVLEPAAGEAPCPPASAAR
jgi:DNA-binding response OmpR family regulator